MQDVIFLAWEKHRRTKEIADYLNIETVLLESNHSRIIKHPFFMLQTLKILRKKHPKVLIVQNPSLVLTAMVCLLKKMKIFDYFLLVDSHNEGVVPFVNKWPFINIIYNFILKTADITIVTNEKLARIVQEKGGKSLVLPDRIPEKINTNEVSMDGDFKYVFICTFSKDEPVDEILKASLFLDKEDKIYITGNYKKANSKILEDIPEKVVLTGFLEDSDYWGYLKNADFVIDLTLMEDCLVCGAYEAVSVGTPLILSDTAILRETFYKGAIFTLNDPASIGAALKMAKMKKKTLTEDIGIFKNEFVHEWQIKGESLRELLFQASRR